MCFDICTINIRVSIRVRGLHLVSFFVSALPETHAQVSVISTRNLLEVAVP